MGGTSWAMTGACAVACALCVLSGARAQAPAPPAPQPDYHPSLGDLMTMAVQPRHAKLGLGGQMRNWDYAAYESSELRNAFARIARTIPAYRGQAMATLFASTIKDPLDQLDAAVKSKDAARFDAAYGQVTQACNACHQALDHAFVVIKPPSGTPYPNQAFAP